MPITLHIYNWKTKHTSWHIMTHHDISHLLDLHPHRAGHVHSTIDCSPQFLQTMKQKTHTFKTPHWMLDMDYTMNGTGLCWQLSLHTIGLFHYLWELYMKHPSFQHSHHASFHGSLFPHIIHQCPISHKAQSHSAPWCLSSYTITHIEQHSTSITLNTQCTAWLSEYAACSSLLDCMPLSICTIFYFPSLHEYTIPHSITSFQYRWCPSLYTMLHTVCMQSSTSFQYSRYLTLQDWLSTYMLLRTGHVYEHTEWTRLQKYMNKPAAQVWTSKWTQSNHKTGQAKEHTEYSGLDKCMDTLSAQDWPYNWTHTQCTGLAKYPNTPSAQDWASIWNDSVHKAGYLWEYTLSGQDWPYQEDTQSGQD